MDLWEVDDLSSNQPTDNGNPTESEFSPYKPNEYRLYLIWKALPVNALDCNEIAEGLSIERWELEQVAGIKTQSEFAKRFGIHPGTLTEWNNHQIPSDYAHLDWRTWAKSLTKEVVFSLYQGILEHADAARVRLWFNYIDIDASKVPNNTLKDEPFVIDSLKALIEYASEVPENSA